MYTVTTDLPLFQPLADYMQRCIDKDNAHFAIYANIDNSSTGCVNDFRYELNKLFGDYFDRAIIEVAYDPNDPEVVCLASQSISINCTSNIIGEPIWFRLELSENEAHLYNPNTDYQPPSDFGYGSLKELEAAIAEALNNLPKEEV